MKEKHKATSLSDHERNTEADTEQAEPLVDGTGNPVIGGVSQEKAERSDDLSSHTVAELKEIAEDEEVDLTGITTKADIIAAIEEKRG